MGTLTIEYLASGRTKTMKFFVYPQDPEKVIKELKELLAGIADIYFTPAGGKVMVTGKLRSENDKFKFDTIMSLYPNVIDLTEKTDLLIEISAIVVEINSEDEFSFKLDLSPKSKYDTSAAAWVWLKKGPSELASSSVLWGLSADVLKSVTSLIDNGKAKVISNPRIITNNGKEAEIFAGGEIPYQIYGPQGEISIEYKTYGVKLKVTPHRKTTNEILMDLYVEASEPGAGTNPSINSRSARIQVSVPHGRTLIIGGLFNTQIANTSGAGCLLPYLNFIRRKVNREILVLVTPNSNVPDGIPIQQFKMIKEQDIQDTLLIKTDSIQTKTGIKK